MFLIRIIFYSKSKFWTLLSTVIWFRKYKEGRFVFFENLIGLQNRVEEGRQFSQRIKSWPISEMFTTAITSPFFSFLQKGTKSCWSYSTFLPDYLYRASQFFLFLGTDSH